MGKSWKEYGYNDMAIAFGDDASITAKLGFFLLDAFITQATMLITFVLGVAAYNSYFNEVPFDIGTIELIFGLVLISIGITFLLVIVVAILDYIYYRRFRDGEESRESVLDEEMKVLKRHVNGRGEEEESEVHLIPVGRDVDVEVI